MKDKLLIVEDDRAFCGLLKNFFSQEYEVTAFTDPVEAAEYISENEIDVVLTDMNMPVIDGMEILRRVKAEADDADVLIMTAYADVETAVEAMKKGAYSYIVKPFTTDELSLQLMNIFEKRGLTEENINLRNEIASLYSTENIIGKSKAILEISRFIEQVSQTDGSVLIIGESGTEKELVAKAIHFSGKRSRGVLISLHCRALPEESLERELFGCEEGASPGAVIETTGFFEEADRGTIVINEIEDMAIPLQSKLLRVLESRRFRRIGGSRELTFDGMVVLTTGRDQIQLRHGENFLPELMYSNMIMLRLPPLRERKHDIPMLVEHYLSQCKTRFGRHTMQISKDTMGVLKDYAWPGNEKELQIFISQICLLETSNIIRPEHIYKKMYTYSEKLSQGSTLPESGISLDEVEKNLIRETLFKADGIMTEAAKLLNISYHTLRYRMKKYGIK